MDSLLSNSQRCTRKAESLIACGLFDEALVQLDKSISYLLELKAASARLDTNQFLNEQIEAVDRKKRLVAIKRAESIRKKNQLEALINKSKELQSLQAVVIQQSSAHNHQTKFRHGSKLSKDDKCVLEELSTSNAEFKKVNAYLANEIEELKKENEFLKVELIKAKLSDDESSDQQPPSSSSYRQRTATTNTTASVSTVNNSLPHEIQALNQHIDDDEDDDDDDIAIVESLKDAGSQTIDALEIRISTAAAPSNTSPANTTSSSSHSSSSMTVSSSQTSSSATTNSSSLNDISSSTGNAAPAVGVTTEFYKDSQQQNLLNMTRVRRELLLPVQQLSSPQFKQNNRVDLSQYINEEDDDDDDDDVEVSHNLDDSDYACNQGHGAIHSPPNEFTID